MRRFYSPMFQAAAARVQVTALCDLEPDNLRIGGLLFPSSQLHGNPVKMLEREDLDAVIVLTSENANAETAGIALEAGLPVYLEKPPARTPTEFAELRAAEDRSSAPLFAAFNRRHMPLLKGFSPPAGLFRVSGRMERLERPVPTFPYTALHLIDSLLYFSGSSLEEFQVDFAPGKPSRWTVWARLDSGAICELEIIPDGREHTEHLLFEGEEETVEIQFPNPESHFPVGRLTRVFGGRASLAHGNRNDALYEMGYSPAFHSFLEHLENELPPSDPFRLASCQSAIAIMAAMVCAENLA